jgi:hypothetical protein
LTYRTLYILVEGGDDARFFERVVRPMFEDEFGHVQLWQYSQQEKEKVNKFLDSIRAMQGGGIADLIIVADLDESPCVTDRKERIPSGFRSLSAGQSPGQPTGPFSSTRILIVCREIESWYLAGLNDEECKRLGLTTTIDNTDRISKEQFLDLMPDRFDSKSEFMLEILRVFDHETARSKNSSFRYFMQNYGTDQQ